MAQNESARNFWNGQGAAGYPNRIRVGGEVQVMLLGSELRQAIGSWMKPWILPGYIFDLGAGPTSHLLFDSYTLPRVFAADFAPNLLQRGGIPPERWWVGDLAEAHFFENWRGRFGTVASVFLLRYLTSNQRTDLLRKTYDLLQPGGRLVLVDLAVCFSAAIN